MSGFSRVNTKTQIEVDRLDGGLNTKGSVSDIEITETPDCLNVEYGDSGSVKTRQGTSYYNSSAIASFSGDGLVNYNGTMVAFVGGSLYRMSGTTAVTVPSAQSVFTPGTYVGYEIYQNILFCSDGTNGPFRYEGGNNFYNMGISVPSAPTAASNGAGNIAAGSYYYKVAFVNTHVVEGQMGSASTGTTIAASASIQVTGISVGTSMQGVAKRNVYRASSISGTYNFVKEIADNVTTSFTDNVGVGSVGVEGITDGSSLGPFTTIKAHKERLWMDDYENDTIGRYTEFQNPFISKALNLIPMNQGDLAPIRTVGVQDDLVTWLKDGSDIWLTDAVDPTDDATWTTIKSPANVGIIGMRAMTPSDNGLVFIAQKNDRIIGIQYLSGLTTIQTTDGFLRTRNISEKIESLLFTIPRDYWSKIAMTTYDNRIFIAVPYPEGALRNTYIIWFDINRLKPDGQPGSWSIWAGDVGVNDFAILNGELYGISSDSDGMILKFNNGTFTDASGDAIDSYWWSKEIGGEPAIESWFKDWRHVNVWHQKLGAYNMNVRVRIDGASGYDEYPIDLTSLSAQYGSAIWGVSYYSEGARAFEKQVPIGPKLGRRIQVGFDNQNTAGQGFNVHSMKILMNLRRQR